MNMISQERIGDGLAWKAVFLAMGALASIGPLNPALGDGPPPPPPPEPSVWGSLFPSKLGMGDLGYGPPGLHSGFAGFGLGFHRGYGFGGDGLGVGAHGGYPYYGGPGYPHGDPRLRRFGANRPFPYYGGPGDACHGPTQRYAPTGPLVVDQPVVKVDDPYAQDYGSFSGVIPYAETVFAPYAAAAAATGSSAGVPGLPPGTAGADGEPEGLLDRPTTSTSPEGSTGPGGLIQAIDLGFEQEPAVDPNGVRVMKVRSLRPGSPADKGLLGVGDLIYSINGYHTDQPGNLPWITSNAAPDRVLKVIVHSARDGKERSLMISLP
jgi:hypothetical protein